VTDARRVGVVGLGNIGGALATNLAADGHHTTVTDLDPERAAAIVGAHVVASVAELAAAAHITFTSLPTPDVVAEVARAWASAAAPGSILVDCSTTSPAINQQLAEELAVSGHHFVEAPLTGGAIGARGRTLVFLVGGDDEPVAQVRPLLDQLGRATFHLGPVGTGTTMKLVNSLLAFTSTWASLEALSLAAAAGIDLRDAVQAVRTGGASNFYIDRGVEGIGVRDRPVQFSLDLAAKDAGLLQDLAAAHDVPAPIVDALAEVLTDAVARGLGGHDWGDLVLAAEARSGQPLVLGPESAP